jgi:hypothetical protein
VGAAVFLLDASIQAGGNPLAESPVMNEDMRIEISDKALALVELDKALTEVMSEMVKMNQQHFHNINKLNALHMQRLEPMHEMAAKISDAIHKIEQSLIGAKQ